MNPSHAPAFARDGCAEAIERIEIVPTILRIARDALAARATAVVGAGGQVIAAVPDGALGSRIARPFDASAMREPVAEAPIVLRDGRCIGHVCAFGLEHGGRDGSARGMLDGYARLIAAQLDEGTGADGMQAALLDAQAAAELREQFIAVLGHDLRNPLNVVATNTQLLEAVARDGATREIAQRIGRSVRRMAGLIDDVLDFARGRLGGGLDIRFEDVHDVAQALVEVVDEVRSMHPGRVIEVSIDAPKAVRCDRARIQQLAANLLSNALKHGAPTAPVQYSATVSAGSVVLTVTNQGEPIPPEHLRRVFEPFWRHSGSRREGLGLGLFICAEIARAHGGRIEVMSDRENGTTFAAHLPVGSTARR